MDNWADFTASMTARKGPLVLGIDPVYADIPDIFKISADTPHIVVQKYIDLMLELSGEQIGFIKYQSAFFEALGSDGIKILAYCIQQAKRLGHGVILDAKRGDVGGTAAAYAQAYLAAGGSDLEIDCMTINPFLGPETLEPFVNCAKKYGKGLFILVKTSNPGAGWLQDQQINGSTVSEHIAHLIARWSEETVTSSGLSPIGAVVGATYPKDGQNLRQILPHSIFLAPGLGPQGGKAEEISALAKPDGTGVLIPVQRGITKTDDLTLSQNAYADLVRSRITAYKKGLSS